MAGAELVPEEVFLMDFEYLGSLRGFLKGISMGFCRILLGFDGIFVGTSMGFV